eukprot:Skav233089  [mRNA]  locus=scaffold986:55845:59343:- [translate_table: standard]
MGTFSGSVLLIRALQVQVDVLVLSSGGNLVDSLALALCAVLSETLLPKVDVIEALEEGEDVQLKAGSTDVVGGIADWLVCGEQMKQLPLCVTVAEISGKFLMDVTSEEEMCAEAMLCVVVDGKTGDVIGLHKQLGHVERLGRGLFDMSAMPAMLERCKATAAVLAQQWEAQSEGRAAAVAKWGTTMGFVG